MRPDLDLFQAHHFPSLSMHKVIYNTHLNDTPLYLRQESIKDRSRNPSNLNPPSDTDTFSIQPIPQSPHLQMAPPHTAPSWKCCRCHHSNNHMRVKCTCCHTVCRGCSYNGGLRSPFQTWINMLPKNTHDHTAMGSQSGQEGPSP